MAGLGVKFVKFAPWPADIVFRMHDHQPRGSNAMKTIGILAILMLQFSSAAIAPARAYPVHEARAYILEKLARHDVVFMGTVHRQPAILKLAADLLPQLHSAGITHLALEISSDQQYRIDAFMETGQGLDGIALHAAIDCPQYRRLFHVLRDLAPDRRPKVVAIDLPAGQYGGPVSRNAYMARSLAAILQARPQSRILTILGSLHVLRRLNWQHRVGSGNDAVRTHLERRLPDLKVFSLVNLVDAADAENDFIQWLAPLPGAVALDLDRRFKGWRLGITDCMALRPAQPYDLVDGVVVH